MGKNEPVSIADEVSFEIPDSWEWVRLKNIANVVSAKRVHKSDWQSPGIPFYRAREIGKLSEQIIRSIMRICQTTAGSH